MFAHQAQAQAIERLGDRFAVGGCFDRGAGRVARVVAGDDFSNVEDVLNARIPGKGGQKIEALVQEARSSAPADEDNSNQSS